MLPALDAAFGLTYSTDSTYCGTYPLSLGDFLHQDEIIVEFNDSAGNIARSNRMITSALEQELRYDNGDMDRYFWFNIEGQEAGGSGWIVEKCVLKRNAAISEISAYIYEGVSGSSARVGIFSEKNGRPDQELYSTRLNLRSGWQEIAINPKYPIGETSFIGVYQKNGRINLGCASGGSAHDTKYFYRPDGDAWHETSTRFMIRGVIVPRNTP